MPASPKSPAGARRHILLIEGYDALAAALGAALEKFAPDHAISIVSSCSAAQSVVNEIEPDLLVLDFDPPVAGAMEFFHAVRSLEARVLIVVGGKVPDALRERKQAALHFLEKPFELAEFGAAVIALLDTDVRALRGSLLDFNLSDVIPLFCFEGRTAMVRAEMESGSSGEIHFERGQIVHAIAGQVQGAKALYEIMRWKAARFATEQTESTSARTIQGRWPAVLEDAIRFLPPPEKPAEPRTFDPSGKKVVVVEDTETLRIFVEDLLASAVPDLQAFMAPDASAGLRKTASILPDFVLLDYSLPDFNGDEFCRRLLAEEKTARIPVVMMSGHVAEMTAAAKVFPNIIATIAKPFLSGALIELVRKILRGPPPEEAPTKAKTKPAPKQTNMPPAQPLPRENAIASPVQQQPPPARPSSHLFTPVRFAVGRDNGVVVGLPLFVVSMQFSSTLQMAVIRARPCSRIISLRIDPRSLPGASRPEAGFELERVGLDTRGHIQTLCLAPTRKGVSALPSAGQILIDAVAVLPTNGDRIVQLTPAAAAPMKMQLLASFELGGVELSPGFELASLVLISRSRKMRVSLHPESANTGATFESAQVLLDHSARIAEVLLDAVA